MPKSPNKPQWYLIQCKSRQELRAQENLRNQHFPCYCPMHSVEKIRQGKHTLVEQPLFSGYLFIHLSKLTDNWHSIRSTRGVQRLVTFAGNPLPVGDELVEALKARLTEAESTPLFTEGEKVTISDGPFKDLEAVFCMPDGEERAIVLLTLLQRQQQIRVPLSQLKTAT